MTNEEKDFVNAEAKAINIPNNMIQFRSGKQTCYDELADKVFIGSDVMPSNDGSTHNRDIMSVRAVLAHEYYGHHAFSNTKIPAGDWHDEFRASYKAAVSAPNLSKEDRAQLMRDALDRAKDAGADITITDTIRGVLYGF